VPEAPSLAMALVASLELPEMHADVPLDMASVSSSSVVYVGDDFDMAVEMLVAFTSQFHGTQMVAREGIVFLYGEGSADFHELVFEDGSRAFLIGSEAHTPYNDLF
jgi:hypothetical protein